MNQNAPMPSELRHWITDHLPDLDAVTDVSWPRGDSRVWRLVADRDRIFVKLSPSPESYEREIAGYAYAARVLAPREAPRLLAADPGLQAIMTSELPGHIVRGLLLERDEERNVHERAGNLLRRWHDHSAAPLDQDRRMIHTAIENEAREAAHCLERTTGHLDSKARALTECAFQELPDLAKSLPVVYRHGDYSTRNWLWDARHGHGVIDFEMSDYGIAVQEFVWLFAAVWAIRPDLKTAYLSGYGRVLSDSEERALVLLAARLGVSYLATGLDNQNCALIERGYLILTRAGKE